MHLLEITISRTEIILVIVFCCVAGLAGQWAIYKYLIKSRKHTKTDLDGWADKINQTADKGYNFAGRFFFFVVFGFLAFYVWSKL